MSETFRSWRLPDPVNTSGGTRPAREVGITIHAGPGTNLVELAAAILTESDIDASSADAITVRRKPAGRRGDWYWVKVEWPE